MGYALSDTRSASDVPSREITGKGPRVMRITDLKTYVMGTAWRNLIFIELETDEGITGVGEATLHNFEEAMVGYLDALKDKYVIGRDPFDVERLARDIQRDDFWAAP